LLDTAVWFRAVLFTGRCLGERDDDGYLSGDHTVVIIQIIGLGIVAYWPGLATWLPKQIFG